ncbi:MAG: hydrogenase expression/formation protein HypD [Deferribacteraceae bacterium]|nr:hydrogenase expression/formation protein HypD [Deferribacteraceae bacterium]
MPYWSTVMQMVTKFRDKNTVKSLLSKIQSEARSNRQYRIMEVCGTHTMSISRFGIRSLLPDNIKLISGPGCPVCVTSQGEIDLIFELLQKEDVVLAVYGDLMKVPGSAGENLIELKSSGKDIRVILSPLDVIKIKESVNKPVVFVSIGFETTTPASAGLAHKIVCNDIKDIYFLVFNKTMPEIIKVLLKDKELNIDGFLCPGHVTAITGEKLYLPIVDNKKAASIAGFEPVDILYSILEIINQVNRGKFYIANSYSRVVRAEENKIARSLIEEYFEPADSYWRGIGVIEKSGLKLKKEYEHLDAVKKFNLKPRYVDEIAGCRCGDVLKGKILPNECKMFGGKCKPDNPVGPCMVSGEGACAAYYKYEIFQ